jgi:hypothetical protein
MRSKLQVREIRAHAFFQSECALNAAWQASCDRWPCVYAKIVSHLFDSAAVAASGCSSSGEGSCGGIGDHAATARRGSSGRPSRATRRTSSIGTRGSCPMRIVRSAPALMKLRACGVLMSRRAAAVGILTASGSSASRYASGEEGATRLRFGLAIKNASGIESSERHLVAWRVPGALGREA